MKTSQLMGWGLPVCFLAGGTLHGADTDLNRLMVNGRYSLNVLAKYSSSTPTPNIGDLLPGTPRSYNDGFVAKDLSGNAGGKTWNWSYNDAAQMPVPGTLNFHTSTSPTDGITRHSRDGGLPGLEVRYGRVLGQFPIGRRKAKWGLLGGLGYTDLHLRDNGIQSGAITGITDSYAVRAGIPLAPYAGAGFAGPGPLIPDTPATRAPFAGTATSAVRNEVNGGIYAFTLGPFFEIPLGDKWQVDLGVGGVAATARRRYSFAENTTITAPVGVPGVMRTGEVDSTDWLFGVGVRLGAGYNLTDFITLEAGVDYQRLGTTSQSVNGKAARLDLENVVSFTGGVRWRF